jgi:hypothetical protein
MMMRELFVLAYPMLLSLSIFSDYNYWSLLCILMLAILLIACKVETGQMCDGEMSFNRVNLKSRPRLPFITMFKGSNMFLTCICILAIDFKVTNNIY